MAKQVINSGTIANDGTGDTLRVAANKINSNFTEVYDAVDAIQQVNSDWSATTGVTEILNKPDLFSGIYTDLTAIPVFADVATSGSYVDLSDQPHLSSVAISGSYADLSNKPALFSGSYSDLTNKPTLFSGSYSDLTSKPTIPNNTTQLINGNNWITLSSVTWANLLNKPSFATVATSGSYADLTNKPTIPLAYSLPTASTSILGGVKVDGTTITITNGVISATGGGGSGSGDVIGPATATDNAIARFDTTTGKLIQNSLVTISDTGAIVAPIASSIIPFHYDNQAGFPSATTYHGAIAHSHADGKLYFAHSGVWLALANASELPAAQVQSDWNAISGLGQILNKPTIPAAQIQSDWNQTTVGALDYIRNKPPIPASLTALGIADGTPGQVLSTNGFGAFSFITVSGAGGSGLPTRSSATGTTASLATNATENMSLTGFKSYMLLKIVTSEACWVRIYSSVAARTADSGRLINTDPTPSSGVIAEAVTTGADTVALTPGAYGFSNEAIPTTSIPIAITNKAGTTTAITVVLTILQLEV